MSDKRVVEYVFMYKHQWRGHVADVISFSVLVGSFVLANTYTNSIVLEISLALTWFIWLFSVAYARNKSRRAYSKEEAFRRVEEYYGA